MSKLTRIATPLMAVAIMSSVPFMALAQTSQALLPTSDTTEEQRKGFLAGKLFWLSGVLGGGAPVWILDPRDAQYLNTTLEELRKSAAVLAAEGALRLAEDAEYAVATAKLMEQREAYQAELAQALTFIKPTFNEDMRGGLTNM